MMKKMKDFTIKLDRVKIDSGSEENETHSTEMNSRPRQKSSAATKSTVIASTPQPIALQKRQTAKKADGASLPPPLDEMISDGSPNATASTSRQAKRRGQPPTKENNEKPGRRALRSNSSIDEVSYASPEPRSKRKKRNQLPKTKEAKDSMANESSEDESNAASIDSNAEQVKKVRGKKTKNVLHRQRAVSTDEDDSMDKSYYDNESDELPVLDVRQSIASTRGMANSTVLNNKTPPTLPLIESDNEMTPLLRESLNVFGSPNSEASEEVIKHSATSYTGTPNTMDQPMEETPLGSKTKENRRGTYLH